MYVDKLVAMQVNTLAPDGWVCRYCMRSRTWQHLHRKKYINFPDLQFKLDSWFDSRTRLKHKEYSWINWLRLSRERGVHCSTKPSVSIRQADIFNCTAHTLLLHQGNHSFADASHNNIGEITGPHVAWQKSAAHYQSQ